MSSKLTPQELEEIRKRSERADVVWLTYNTGPYAFQAREDIPKLITEIYRLQKLLRNESWIGKEIADDYCNGYFGGQEFHFKNAIVSDETPLSITVRRRDGRYFKADFDDTDEKYEYMVQWTTEDSI